MLRIKRYNNRKLYDTINRRYITLPEIAALLRQGEEIQVTDHETGSDLTTLIMLQALFSAERRSSGWLTSPSFSRLVEAGEKSIQHFLNSLPGLVNYRQLVDREIQHRLNHLVENGSLQPEEAERLATLLMGTPSPSSGEAGITSPDSRSTLEQLMADLERLSSMLDEIAPPERD